MRLALVCAPPDESSDPGVFARSLLPALETQVEVELFSEPAGGAARPIDELGARSADRILYQVADDARAAFLLPALRRLGGTVLLHDWSLAGLARAAWPELEAAGWRGWLRALREGGLAGARAWRAREAGAPLNRGVVRWADAFLVLDPQLGRRVLDDRRAHTPIGCLLSGELACAAPPGTSAAREHERLAAGRWPELARQIVSQLEVFPPHRSARKSLIRSAIEDADRHRREREAEGSGS